MDDFGKQVPKFIFEVGHISFFHMPMLQMDTEAEMTLKIHSSSLARL